ncbi:hypothetical protein CXB51_025801 [Gossypium anomalum]|uniref:Reverse transcriptase Ty1/copia-type domain-containing protein n=1 Tax=Gossypium anomalum TaxID=47600 RepID=A0A8J5YDA9_9ROSI|nr:hypothetical protein CXB51_025801 [Gossypium anomalum]
MGWTMQRPTSEKVTAWFDSGSAFLLPKRLCLLRLKFRADKDAYKKHLDEMVDVRCLMLATMNSELQKQHEDMVAYDMIEHLKELYRGQARQERFDISNALFQCKLAEGSPGKGKAKVPTKPKGKAELPLLLRKSRRPKQAERLLQGLQRSRTLARGDVDLRVGNRARVAATYTLSLPSGLGKMTKSFTGKSERASDLLGSIHSDVCGPINTQARGRFHYFITFTDDFSRYGYLYLMRHKSEALEKFKEFKNEECGIVSQLTPPESADLLTSFWGHALETAIFTLNRVPSKSVQKTPYEMWIGKCPKTQPPRRSLREHHAPERYGFLITTYGDILLIDQDEPRTYQEAVVSPDSEKWLKAMRFEMDSMYENQVWTLVDPPEGVKPIGCKWVFKKKTDIDGNVQTYKGRLVAKGFHQIHGVDYDETFSPVAMFKSIKILFTIAAFHDYEIWQMDVKTAFLNGKLEEDVYMTQPEGFVNPKDAGKIYDPCVYKKVSGNTITFLVLYMDDHTYLGNDIPTLQSIKTWLGSLFSMKDLGEATYILGVKIYRDRSRRLLDVSYALSMTSRYQVDPGERHWTTVKNILKYLRRTKDTFLIYGGEEELSVKGYTDASFQTDKDDSRLQSEAEYIAASEVAKEAVWIKKFITELGVVPSISDAIELRCDNNGAITQAKEPRSHQQSNIYLGAIILFERLPIEGCRDM